MSFMTDNFLKRHGSNSWITNDHSICLFCQIGFA